MRMFFSADDLFIDTQTKDFGTLEKHLNKALEDLSEYYEKWFLSANPGKTHICALHLNNHLANKTLNIK